LKIGSGVFWPAMLVEVPSAALDCSSKDANRVAEFPGLKRS
jgi:hypothetical protein